MSGPVSGCGALLRAGVFTGPAANLTAEYHSFTRSFAPGYGRAALRHAVRLFSYPHSYHSTMVSCSPPLFYLLIPATYRPSPVMLYHNRNHSPLPRLRLQHVAERAWSVAVALEQKRLW